MKFTCQVDIQLPREKVVELWKNPENLKYWQDGFEGYEHLSGVEDTEGAQAILHYDIKGRLMELKETITESNLPEVMEGKYEHQHMTNNMRNLFEVIDKNTTRWKAEIHYVQFNGWFMKLFALFGKSLFRKQTQKWLDQFKAFAEEQNG